MQEADVIVVGAGISGMSFAHYCARSGLETLVLEKGRSAGGCLQSHRYEDGFWFELGAHTCYNSYRELLGIIEARLGLDRLMERERLPFRLLAGGEIRSIIKELSIWRLFLSALRLPAAVKAGHSVAEYYGRIVGARNYERVFGPLLSAVPSQRADGFPADMLFKRRTRRKDIARSFTLRGGLQSVVDAVAEDPHVTLRLSSEVTTVERIERGVRICLDGGETLEARHLVMAVPPPVGVELLREAAPALAAAFGRIGSVTVRSVGVVVRKEAVIVERVAGIIPVDGDFFSAVSRDVVPHPELRAFTFHFGHTISEEEGIRTAVKVLGVERTQVVDVVSREVVLPSPAVGHDEIVREIERACRQTPFFVTGNYFGGLAIEDCVIRSKEEARRLRAAVGRSRPAS
jgi:protoporphyrinogen oxidase